MGSISSTKRQIVRLNQAAKRYNGRWVFRSVNLAVGFGECIGLIGPSGSGKTTLLRSIVGFEKLDEGEIFLHEVPLDYGAEQLARVRKKIGFVAQGLYLWPYRTALQNVMEGPLFSLRLSKKDASERGKYWLNRMGVDNHANKYISQLSGGEQQRVAIARSLAVEPEMLILDEPTSGLDPVTSGRITELLRELGMSGITLLVV